MITHTTIYYGIYTYIDSPLSSCALTKWGSTFLSSWSVQAGELVMINEVLLREASEWVLLVSRSNLGKPHVFNLICKIKQLQVCCKWLQWIKYFFKAKGFKSYTMVAGQSAPVTMRPKSFRPVSWGASTLREVDVPHNQDVAPQLSNAYKTSDQWMNE